MHSYDLILGVTTFRRLVFYLSIVKYLSNELKIGIYSFEIDKRESLKTDNTNRLYLDFCKKYGVHILKTYPVKTKILLVPKSNYKKDQIINLKKNIISDKCFVFFPLMEGNRDLESLLSLSIDKYLIVDKNIYNLRLDRFEDEKKIDLPRDKVVELGLPVKKYPVFENIELDYLIAIPTPFSLPRARDRFAFVRCVLKLLEKIDAKDKVVLKPHNGDERTDYIVNSKIYVIFNYLKVPLLRRIIEQVANCGINLFARFQNPIAYYLHNFSYQVLTCIYYTKLQKKTSLLKDITPYYNFGLEIFLPQVKKGVITGLSNTIWHALFHKLPVYNCADKNNITLNPNKFHTYSMNYLNIPFCDGRLEFNETKSNLIKQSVRNADMISFLKEELSSVRQDITNN